MLVTLSFLLAPCVLVVAANLLAVRTFDFHETITSMKVHGGVPQQGPTMYSQYVALVSALLYCAARHCHYERMRFVRVHNLNIHFTTMRCGKPTGAVKK